MIMIRIISAALHRPGVLPDQANMANNGDNANNGGGQLGDLGSPIWKPRDGGGPCDMGNKEVVRGGAGGQGQQGGGQQQRTSDPPRPGSRANNVAFSEGENLQAACKRTPPTASTHK